MKWQNSFGLTTSNIFTPRTLCYLKEDQPQQSESQMKPIENDCYSCKVGEVTIHHSQLNQFDKQSSQTFFQQYSHDLLITLAINLRRCNFLSNQCSLHYNGIVVQILQATIFPLEKSFLLSKEILKHLDHGPICSHSSLFAIITAKVF